MAWSTERCSPSTASCRPGAPEVTIRTLISFVDAANGTTRASLGLAAADFAPDAPPRWDDEAIDVALDALPPRVGLALQRWVDSLPA